MARTGNSCDTLERCDQEDGAEEFDDEDDETDDTTNLDLRALNWLPCILSKHMWFSSSSVHTVCPFPIRKL